VITARHRNIALLVAGCYFMEMLDDENYRFMKRSRRSRLRNRIVASFGGQLRWLPCGGRSSVPRPLADLLHHLGVSALDRFSQGIGAVLVKHGAKLGTPGDLTRPVGIADLAFGELFFKHLLYSVKLIEYV
jgi:hypothetical protein